MQDWFESHGCDGWNLIPPYMPGPALECLEWLVPELQRRGAFQTEYQGDGTLRSSLGLARPAFRSRGCRSARDRHVPRSAPALKTSDRAFCQTHHSRAVTAQPPGRRSASSPRLRPAW